MQPRNAVIFDLDGTLLDTLEDLATSGNRVLQNHGLPGHSTEAYRTFIGDGMTNLVRRIFPDQQRPAPGAETEKILHEYRAAYAEHWQDTTRPFPGIAPLLDRLTERGVPIGVLSNKAHDFTLKCMQEFLPDWHWSIVLGARDGVPTKPSPEAALEAANILQIRAEDCFFVGDSDVDMHTATNAGMRAVGVSWGFRSREELVNAGAETILQSPQDLLSLLS